jgi:glycosyltransferase involved in cell wall biosynthesis
MVETGILVEKENSAGLASAISYLLGHPETAVGNARRQRAEAVFGLDAHVDAYEALYNKLATTRLQLQV